MFEISGYYWASVIHTPISPTMLQYIGNHVLGVNMMNTGGIVDFFVVGKNAEKLFLL